MSKKAANGDRRISTEQLPDPCGTAASSHMPAMLLLQKPASQLKTERMAPSSVLARVRDFLPQMAAANDQLTSTATDGSADDLITIEKVVPTAESSSSSNSSDDSTDGSSSEDDEPEVVDGPRKIAMDVMLFANDDEDAGDDNDEDDEVPAAWRMEGDKSKTNESSPKKSKIEEL